MKVKLIFKGGPGSGHHGHSGRPGKHGGSTSGGGSGGSVPSLSQSKGKDAVAHMYDKMAAAGLKRDGGIDENRGVLPSNYLGAPGFFVQDKGDDKLEWQMTLSGKSAGVRYRNFSKWEDDEEYQLHQPLNPESLSTKISSVFSSEGFNVAGVKVSGWQEHWDDDISYIITTDRNGLND